MQISSVLCLQQNHGDFPDGVIIYPLHGKVAPEQTGPDCRIQAASYIMHSLIKSSTGVVCVGEEHNTDVLPVIKTSDHVCLSWEL